MSEEDDLKARTDRLFARYVNADGSVNIAALKSDLRPVPFRNSVERPSKPIKFYTADVDKERGE
jgi:hypothetical protein